MNIQKTYQKGAAMVWVLLLILAAAGAYVYFSPEGSVDEILNQQAIDNQDTVPDQEVVDNTPSDNQPSNDAEIVSYDIEVVGTLQYVDVEGGCWRFATDNGDDYQLIGLPDNLFVDNARLMVRADYADDMAGICQIGQFIDVIEYEVLDIDTVTIRVPLWTDSQTSTSFAFAGCGGYMDFVEYEVPQTEAVLRATYQKLFELPSGENNAVGTQTALSFENVTLANNIASVYLSGEIWANHCADAIFRAQIDQAAFQFDSVVITQV